MQVSNVLSFGKSNSINVLTLLKDLNPRMFYVGLISFLTVPLFILLSVIDIREVVGVNTWIKPIKFAISIGTFLWSMAWYLDQLKEFPKFKERIEKYFLISLSVELILITIQSARGVQSHFNQSSLLDGAIYSIMGMFIFPMIPVAIWMDHKFARMKSDLDPRIKVGIRFSLWIFAIASVVGVFMSARLAHSVGVPDGGPGLPLVNWSRNGGDIRIAHFLGIHSLQVLPLISYIAIRKNWKTATVGILSLGFGLSVLAVFLHAMMGRPLL
ncbi:hypothetical protein ACE5IS_06420 [Leptospira wolffii]|uniref:Uncharacterized protein n=1 Tax=Leptospira wolffii TaxID=409998 RepID=A0ABV5BIC5_9LEPT